MNPEEWAKMASIIQENYIRFWWFCSPSWFRHDVLLSVCIEFYAREFSYCFTGSQLPIGDLRTDAKENLITAIQIASLRKNCSR
jgi:L-asparaginase